METPLEKPSTSQIVFSELSQNLAFFCNQISSQLHILKPNESIVFPPFAIQNCASLLRQNVVGETSTELERYKIIAEYEKSEILNIKTYQIQCNKIYLIPRYTLLSDYTELLSEKFRSQFEQGNFGETAVATADIQNWLQDIQNRIQCPTNHLVLINVVYFKGEWLHKFAAHSSEYELFGWNVFDRVVAIMMKVNAKFRYANLPDLDATALEMPYKDSDLSMLIVLPNTGTGLAELEKKLNLLPLSAVTDALTDTQVEVKFPKFKAEFEIKLSDIFKQLGVLKRAEVKVFEIVHKAIIDINEEGLQAAMPFGTHAAIVKPPKVYPKYFYAYHPFYYYIINKQGIIFFAGKLLKPDEVDPKLAFNKSLRQNDIK